MRNFLVDGDGARAGHRDDGARSNAAAIAHLNSPRGRAWTPRVVDYQTPTPGSLSPFTPLDPKP